MKAVTVCQPYAELIARGVKPIENRTWPTRYRGPLLIHAGKSREWLDGWDESDERVNGFTLSDMAFGALVAEADLVACLPLLYPVDPYRWPEQWRALAEHEHANGPWCWILENVRRLPQPIPTRGAQGLWDYQLVATGTGAPPHGK